MDNCHLPSPKLTSTLPRVGGWKTTYILRVKLSVGGMLLILYPANETPFIDVFPNSDLRFVRGFPLAQDGAERGKCAST